ncbi:11021_t:CDS:1, partial [Dentiscutata heterogama]
FLKILDTSSIKNGIDMWLKNEGFIDRYNDKGMLTSAHNIVMKSLITMFLRRSGNLEELLINDQLMLPTVTTLLNVMPGTSQLKALRVKLNSINTNILSFMNALTTYACPYPKLFTKIKPYLLKDASDALVNIIKSNNKLEKIELNYTIGRSVIVYNISNHVSKKT